MVKEGQGKINGEGALREKWEMGGWGGWVRVGSEFLCPSLPTPLPLNFALSKKGYGLRATGWKGRRKRAEPSRAGQAGDGRTRGREDGRDERREQEANREPCARVRARDQTTPNSLSTTLPLASLRFSFAFNFSAEYNCPLFLFSPPLALSFLRLYTEK